MPEFALEMRQISKNYGGVRANDRINLAVVPGTIHALAGENGAGKSTLMKILFGLEEPEALPETGIFISGQKVNLKSPLDAIHSGIGMVQQHFALAGALTALDNIILGAEPSKLGLVDRQDAETRLKDIAGIHLSVPWNEETDSLSVGLQQRIEILKLLFRHAKILILDEPTAVLTPQEVEIFFKLIQKLKFEGKTIILITHKLQEVLTLCDKVTVLRHGKVTGEFATRGLTTGDLIRAMIGKEIPPLDKKALPRGEKLVVANDLHVEERHGSGLRGLNLEIHRQEIVGIAGVEGNGQSTLVEALLGLNRVKGTLTYDAKPMPRSPRARRQELNFGVISEDRHHQSIWLDASIAENCAIGFGKKLSRLGFLTTKTMRAFSDTLLKPYNVKMHSTDQKISSLSGGNQQKVVVAREISARKPQFLIASHPTRGVDVGAISFIHQQILKLQEEGSAVLLISSELEELCSLCDRIVVMFEGQAVKEFPRSEFNIEEIGKAMTCGPGSVRGDV